MSTLKYWLKISRPAQSLIAGLGTYVITLLSNGHEWLTVSKIAAPLSMSICVAGSSIFHYGAANKTYARKYWDLVEVGKPWILVMIGSLVMLISSIIAYLYLPLVCFWITLIDALGIGLYARVLSRHWSTKNPIIAFICTTPVLIGWLSGNSLHPALPYFLAIVFFSYLGREIFKDINDIEANGGIRVTLPIWLGSIKRALWVAYVSIFCSCIFLLFLYNTFKTASIYAEIFYLISMATFCLIPFIYLIKGTRSLPRVVTVANSFVLASALALRMTI